MQPKSNIESRKRNIPSATDRRNHSATEKKPEAPPVLTDEASAFKSAMERYKRENRRPFPTWSEVLEVLRSLGYRKVGEQTEAQYERIFRGACEQYGVPYSDDAFRYMLDELHGRDGRPLLACYPRDIVSQVRDLARYESRAPVLDRQVLDWAWNNYFTGN